MLTLAIDASRANKEEKTGVENYSFDIIQSLKKEIPKNIRVILYSPEKLKAELAILPENWEEKILFWPPKRFWTQIRMSFEILFNKPDILFIPAHVFPIIHPKKTIMTIHDVAAIKFPQSFSLFEKYYSIWSAKLALKKLYKIIVPSEFTKQELIKLSKKANKYENKIKVIYHGFDKKKHNDFLNKESEANFLKEKYLLSIGRLEEKKNTMRIIKAFEILKKEEKYNNLKLVLIGKAGYGFEKIAETKNNSIFKDDIIFTGWIDNKETFNYLKNAEIFLFPSLYEGFGLPILEAFFYKVPVIISKNNSLEEIAKTACLKVDPFDILELSKKIKEILDNQDLKEDLVDRGTKELDNFSWEKSGKETRDMLLS